MERSSSPVSLVCLPRTQSPPRSQAQSPASHPLMPATDPWPEPMPTKEPWPATTSAAEPEPQSKSDQVCDNIRDRGDIGGAEH